MKKQTIYSKFIPRIFATTLDLVTLSLITMPITSFCSYRLLIFIFKDFFINNKIDMSDSVKVLESINLQEFTEYMTVSNYLLYVRSVFITNIVILIIIMGLYFIGFWIYKGATPGKIIMHMKIVDSMTFVQPTNWQLVKRFFGYITVPFGIWFMLFSKQHQTLHDKIAGTVVIKS